MKKVLLTLSLAAAVGFSAACNEEKKPEPTAEPAKPAAPATSAPASTSTPAAGGDTKIGIAECDAYLDAYQKCMDNPKVPDAAKATIKSSIEQSRKAWKDALEKAKGTPGSEAVTKATTDACKQAAEALKANALCK